MIDMQYDKELLEKEYFHLQSVIESFDSKSWIISYRKGGVKRLLKVLFWPHVLLPHFAMVVLLLVLYGICL